MHGRGESISATENASVETVSSWPVQVTIAVVTFRRPAGLRVLITRLLEQRATTQECPVQLLVVDNDAARSAETVAAEYASEGVRYVVEPTPGIAAARNRALLEAGVEGVVVFIDDDEHPGSGWLVALLAQYRKTGAAGVAGPVVSEFESEPDAWLTAGRFFDRRRWPSGTSLPMAATNNLLLDLRIVARLGLRFDEKFGISGGSDTLFTKRLVAAGGRLVWCDEAVVVDRVPESRLTRQWVLRRVFRTGNSYSRTTAAMAVSGAGRARAALSCSVSGLLRVAGGVGLLGVGLVSRSDLRQARGYRALYRGAGMMAGAAGLVYSEYQRDASSSHIRLTRKPLTRIG